MPSARSELCISLMPKTTAQLKSQINDTADADMVEVRLDHIPTARFKSIRNQIDKPAIATLRSRNEGGYWRGNKDSYQRIVQRLLDAGFEYVDVEFFYAKRMMESLIIPKGTKVILSHHLAENDFELLSEKLDSMLEIKADVYKFVYAAENLNNNLATLQLIDRLKKLKKRYVVHASGDASRPSRLFGALRGNAWTYVSPNYEEATAPGQLTLDSARHYFHLNEKKADTKILGLVGSQTSQSRGWLLHNKLIHKLASSQSSAAAHDYMYLNFQTDEFDEFWENWSEHLHGLSITLPFKEKVVPYLAEMAPEVKISGVCNTIIRTTNGWKGFNTDLLAIESLLRPHRQSIKDGALIIGTGATARSAIAVMKRLDVNPLFVAGRNDERGAMLVDLFGVDYLSEEEIHYAGASVVVQTTPVGMLPYPDKYPIGTSHFRRGRIVLDVIYSPPETRFLKIARERGCVPISGVEMFIRQAAIQFEQFTNHHCSLEEVREAWNDIL